MENIEKSEGMSLSLLLVLFITYSIIGWVIEEIDILILQKKVVNRGFLIGPYCPIYGFGSLFIILFLNKYLDDPIVLFFMTMISCGILEYLTSFIMEKIFKTRWWDYSDEKFNINGRICLETLVLFGIGGLVISYLAQPFIMSILTLIPTNILNIIAIILSIIFIIDNIVSFKIILNFKLVATNIRKDYTEEITAKVREVLKKKSIFSNRLVKAFPNFKTILKRIKSDKNEEL